jgi:hypothetical protein
MLHAAYGFRGAYAAPTQAVLISSALLGKAVTRRLVTSSTSDGFLRTPPLLGPGVKGVHFCVCLRGGHSGDWTPNVSESNESASWGTRAATAFRNSSAGPGLLGVDAVLSLAGLGLPLEENRENMQALVDRAAGGYDEPS